MDQIKKTQAFPQQKIPFSQKGDTWQKQNIDAAIQLASYDFMRMGKTKMEKFWNYRLANGELDEDDFENAFNPQGLKGVNFPAKAQDYPIETPFLNVLKGEERTRQFNWRVRLVNHDAVSDRENELKGELQKVWFDLVNKQVDEQEIQDNLQKFQKYMNYDYQDIRSKAADRVLRYGWHTQKMKDKFSSGFHDVIHVAEEHYAVDIIMDEPEMTKVNPAHLTILGNGESPYTEDADVIIIDYWKPIGKVMDEFWDELSDEEIDDLEKGYQKRRGDIAYQGMVDTQQEGQLPQGQLIFPDQSDMNAYGGYYDEYGNIKVSHVIWSSFREIKKLTTWEDGEEIVTYVANEYKPDKSKGEKVTKDWVREYWHGYLIGSDKYKKIEPLPRIGEQINNPSICKPPIVGTTYTYNNQKPISQFDRAKPYKYLYDVYMRRAELASARDKGVIGELDLAKKPDWMDHETWMYYAEIRGWSISDSFNTGKKGPAQGKISGQVAQRGSDVMNLTNSNGIKTNLEMAQYVKQEMSEVLGVPPQRLGQMQERETKGGIDMSINKSAHITEDIYAIHDDTKLRALELFLETAKYAWKGYNSEQPKVLDYIDDNLINTVYKLDGQDFAMNQYGLYIEQGYNTEEMLQKISSWGLAAMQNDKISLSALIDAERDTDIVSKIKKIEQAEDKANQREMEMIKQQQQLKARETKLKELELQIEQQNKQKDRALKKYEIDLEAEKGMQDLDRDGLRDSVELQREKLKQQYETERQRIEQEHERKMQESENHIKRDELEQEKELKLKELNEKYKEPKES